MLFTTSSLIIPSFTYAEKSIEDIQQERKELKQNLSKTEKEVATILIEIKELKEEIEEYNETLKANETAIKEVEAEIVTIEKEIAALEKKIEERFDVLKERAQALQKSGGNLGYLEVIFGAKDFNEFISRVSAVTKITDSDTELMEEQERDKAKVEQKLDELTTLRKELEEIAENILEQKGIANEKKEALERKQAKLEKLVKNLKVKDNTLASLESSILSKMATPISGGSFSAETANSSGILGWPTKGGYISSHLGPRWGKMHKGIDIARTDRSTNPPIYAAADGNVEVAHFNNGGYGNMVIINHGNGMKTLYAHMSSLSINAGQSVKKGEQIGVMGKTGNSTGVHLHFEVHVNGAIKNPVDYLK